MQKFIWGSILTLLLISYGMPQSSFAKDYTIPVIRVEVDVRTDGTIRITEHRTYHFEDDFSWADYRLPLRGFSTIKDIQVSEAGSAYINQNTERAGTFIVNRNEDEIQIKWFYSAEDEQRIFTISYTLEGAIVIGPEWAEFFWNYVSADREKATDTLAISLELPRTASADSLHLWKRGARPKITLTKTSAGYRIQATDIDDDEYVQVRSVFPRSIFNQNNIETNDQDFTLSWAQSDEEEYRQTMIALQKKEALYRRYGIQLSIVIVLLSIGALIFLYRKYGKRHKIHTAASESVMIPGRLKPAVAGWLLQGRTISSNLLMATLLDLARRGFFKIEEQKPEGQWLGEDQKVFTIEKQDSMPNDDLMVWEKTLVRFVSQQIEEENKRIDKLFSSSSYSAGKWFSNWKKELKANATSHNWFDQRSKTGLKINIAVQLFFIALSGLAIFLAGPIGIIPLATSLICIAGSAGIIRRTPEGERTYKRWKAYRDGLKNADKYTIGTDLLDKHYIYAIAFGLSKDQVETIFNSCSSNDFIFYWIVLYQGSMSSPADAAGTLSTLSATGTASFPGSTAGGVSGATGASAGAAGGGAAGGAG